MFKNMHEENPFEDLKIAQEWITSVENEKGLFRDTSIYPALQKWLEEVKPIQLLEIGCGQGICSKFVAQKTSYVGIDPSVPLISRANELYNGPNKKFVVGSAYEIPLADNSIDSVFSVNVWFHLKDIEKASSELARVLMPRGKFLIITADMDAKKIWKEQYLEYEEKGSAVSGKINTPIMPLSNSIMYLHSVIDIQKNLEKYHLSVQPQKTICSVEGKSMFVAFSGVKK